MQKVSDLSDVDRVGTRDKTNGLGMGFHKVLGKGGWLGNMEDDQPMEFLNSSESAANEKRLYIGFFKENRF